MVQIKKNTRSQTLVIPNKETGLVELPQEELESTMGFEPIFTYQEVIDCLYLAYDNLHTDMKEGNLPPLRKDDHIELEATINYVGVDPVTRMYENFPNKPVQRVFGTKNMFRNGTKYRGVTDKGLIDPVAFRMNDNDLRWESKTRIKSWTTDVPHEISTRKEDKTKMMQLYTCYAAIEREELHAPMDAKDMAQYQFVISTEIGIENIMFRHRIKYTKTKNTSGVFAVQCLNAPYLEMEVIDIHKPLPDKHTVLMSLAKILGSKIGRCSEANNIRVKTLSVAHMWILQRFNEGTTEMHLTHKYDGLNTRFTIYPDGKIRFANNGQCQEAPTNLAMKGFRIEGFGEMFKGYDGKRYLAPYLIEEIWEQAVKNDGSIVYHARTLSHRHRLDNLLTYNNLLNVDPNPTGMVIHMIPKIIYKNITNPLDFCKIVAENYDRNLEGPTDGMVVMNIGSETSQKDYKFKMNDTVDISCSYTANNNGNESKLSFNVKHGISPIKIQYETEGQYIKITDHHGLVSRKGYLYMPRFFICEYSFSLDNIIGARIDKTNTQYNKSYIGNSPEIVAIIKQGYVEGEYMSLEVIRNIANGSVQLEDVMTPSKENQKWYYGKQTVALSCNLLCNLMKTNCISNANQSICTSKRISTVLDIDAGRGGDLSKIAFLQPDKLVVSDPDNSALEELKRRYKTNFKDKNSSMNLAKVEAEFKTPTYVNEIQKNKIQTFDTINWMFAMAYSWGLEYRKIYCNNLQNLSHKGTKITIGVFCGEYVDRLVKVGDTTILKLSVKKEDKRASGRHHMDHNSSAREVLDDLKEPTPEFCEYVLTNNQNTIDFSYSQNDNRSEPKVYHKDLIKTMTGVGFYLVTDDVFNPDDIVVRTPDGYEPSPLMKMMPELHTHNSIKKMYTNINNQTWTEDDWKYMSLIRFYTFCKY